jgi:hypothetical protein
MLDMDDTDFYLVKIEAAVNRDLPSGFIPESIDVTVARNKEGRTDITEYVATLEGGDDTVTLVAQQRKVPQMLGGLFPRSPIFSGYVHYQTQRDGTTETRTRDITKREKCIYALLEQAYEKLYP